MNEAQIKSWKAKHGEVYAISVADEATEKEYTGYFKKPDLKIIAASAKFTTEDPVKAGIVLMENCWLGGDEELKNNDEMKMGVIQQLSTLFKVKQATIKKL
jgi:hypothetical protein